jgi:DNA-binding NtrC family response regulator
VLNCEGLPDLLVESELFGHTQGSFAGAYRDKPGLLASVRGGTVFLDEVGALSPRMQARLLRFLATGEYLGIGGDHVQIQAQLNVRLIASTAANLPARVDAGLFLDDLYGRLSAVSLSVPPLRERRDDIPSLVDHFVAQFAGRGVSLRSDAADTSSEISSDVYAALRRADWPGNVQELRSVVFRQLLSAH